MIAYCGLMLVVVGVYIMTRWVVISPLYHDEVPSKTLSRMLKDLKG